MYNWYLKKLYEETDQPTLTFAFRGTVNWMRGLAIVCDNNISDEKIQEFYKDVKKRKENSKADLVVFENIMMAIHNLHSLKVINEAIENPYSVSRTQIVSWYYTIYYASSAMIGALSGGVQEQHSKTAKTWQNDIVQNNLVMSPFDLSIDTLVGKDVKSLVSYMRGSNKIDLNTYPTNIDESMGCIYSYLKGTADYKKWQVEEELKKSKEFKILNVDNFRSNVAIEIRDKKLEKGMVNFLVQAFRYRGKAHYRDSVFLSYGNDNTEILSQFNKDLELVATSYLKMASCYCAKRVESDDWESFISDLEENLLFEFDVDILKVGENKCVE